MLEKEVVRCKGWASLLMFDTNNNIINFLHLFITDFKNINRRKYIFYIALIWLSSINKSAQGITNKNKKNILKGNQGKFCL